MSELLLIDDDQELCELLISWLAQEGFVAHACHDGKSARQALAEHQPAAVVLDVMLPDGSGLELLKQLRSEHPELPVLMLSGRGEPLDRILGLELGADDYLAKPCDPRELTARLRAVLRRSQPPATPSQVELGDLCYSPARGIASVGGAEVSLTLSQAHPLRPQPGHARQQPAAQAWPPRRRQPTHRGAAQPRLPLRRLTVFTEALPWADRA